LAASFISVALEALRILRGHPFGDAFLSGKHQFEAPSSPRHAAAQASKTTSDMPGMTGFGAGGFGNGHLLHWNHLKLDRDPSEQSVRSALGTHHDRTTKVLNRTNFAPLFGVNRRTLGKAILFIRATWGSFTVASILPFLRAERHFDDEATRLMGKAFDAACESLDDTGQPIIVREALARRIIEAAKRGERDPDRLRDIALAALGYDRDTR
jgi:hypothetical protein